MSRINVKYQIVFVLILISCIKIHSQDFKLENTELKLENNFKDIIEAELTFKIKNFNKKETFNYCGSKFGFIFKYSG